MSDIDGAELARIVALSLTVSGFALAISSLIGIPLGVWLAMRRFWGKRLIVASLYAGMGFPPVVIGLLVYLLLSRQGPLGGLGWLYAPKAMVAAQVIISLPVVASFTMVAVSGVSAGVRRQALTLGATEMQAALAVLREARLGVVVAVVGGFGSIISEVGAVMIVGGNLKGSTQVLTTAIVQFTRMGLFAEALLLGGVLLGMAFLINVAWLFLQGRRLAGE
ncbi:MAG: tungstate transporter permease [SAR202 cluster bacterium]|nr:tungstate transporter permease [SAR202 cluster bacterium]